MVMTIFEICFKIHMHQKSILYVSYVLVGGREGTVTIMSGFVSHPGHFYVSYVYLDTSLGLRMDPVGTFSSLASPSSVIDVRDHLYQVRLGLPVIFMYNMSI